MPPSRSVRARCAVRGRLVPAVLAVATQLVARSSPADVTAPADATGDVDIRYVVHEGVTGCPTSDEFRAAVKKRLRADVPRSGPALVVTTEIAPRAGGLEARVTMIAGGAPEGVQELVGGKGECATVGAAAALTVALAIERSREAHAADSRAGSDHDGGESPSASGARSEGSERGQGESREPPSAPRTPTEGEPPAPATHAEVEAPRAGSTPPSPSRREAGARAQVWTHVGAFAGYAIAPRWSAGTTFGASLRYAGWSAGLEAVFWPWSNATASGDPDLAARSRLIAARGALCTHVHPFFACATAAIGAYRVAGSGQVISRTDEVVWPALGGRGGVELPISRLFSLALRADVQVPIVRASLELDRRFLWRPPSVGFELGFAWQVAVW